MRRRYSCALVFGLCSVTGVQAQEARDPQIEALISKMTIEEKAG